MYITNFTNMKKLIGTSIKLTEGQTRVLKIVFGGFSKKIRQELQRDIALNLNIRETSKSFVVMYKTRTIEIVEKGEDNRDVVYAKLYNKYLG